MSFNIPKSFTKGDRVSWFEDLQLDDKDGTVSCFIRGQSALDLTGVPDGQGKWFFEISETESATLIPGVYYVQFVSFAGGRNTLGVVKIEVCVSFQDINSLDTRDSDERELEELEKAIAKLSSGVAEYYIGDRRVRYAELPGLYERQKYLRNRIAKKKNKSNIGGRNVGINFC